MKIETANIFGESVSVVNVSQSVGFKGRNLPDDVMLIQGLINYIAKGLSLSAVGLGGDYRIPLVTGNLDANTSTAIAQFQIAQSGSLLRKYFDGRIDPAHYQHRAISRQGAHYMTITQLHFMATDASVMLENGDDGYIEGLAKLSPRLASVIDLAVINS